MLILFTLIAISIAIQTSLHEALPPSLVEVVAFDTYDEVV
jgi:hypothetical protein